MKVKLTYEQQEGIVLNSLKETLEIIESDIDSIKNGELVNYFSTNPKVDKKALKHLRSCLKEVIGYYSHENV